MSVLDPFVRADIAYFSMEIALRADVHTYAGGLGVLAGDIVRTAGDLGLPMVFVTLASRRGYLLQDVDSAGRQIDRPDPWDPAQFATPLGAMVSVTVGGHEVWVRPWLYLHASASGGRSPVILVDTNHEQNRMEDRSITDVLYPDDQELRLKQEIILGIGGPRILRALGFMVRTYHLNEGHSALLAFHLLRETRRPAEDVGIGESSYDPARVREMCVFTTHTPVEASADRFDYALVRQLLGEADDLEELRAFAGENELNMTQLALNLSGHINGVARSHAQVSQRLHPNHHIRAITNGVHAETWTHSAFSAIYDAALPPWRHEPELLSQIDKISDDDLWRAHGKAKSDLIAFVQERCGMKLAEDLPTIVFARRMTAYKRPDLLFADMDRLCAIAKTQPFQLIFAGKAHPRDEGGKALIAHLGEWQRILSPHVPFAFLRNYGLLEARVLVAGADIWLNTPLPPMEASGTSGMKAALNGVLNFSVLDGWWIEACIEGHNGWAIDAENAAATLYAKLADIILPLYRTDRAGWIRMMKQGIRTIGAYFNSHRMMRRYVTETYLR